MSRPAPLFLQTLESYPLEDLQAELARTTTAQARIALNSSRPTPLQFLQLLSPGAAPLLEMMAVKAKELTRLNFGRAIVLFAPVYVSNYCTNQCLYCGFSARQKISRCKLTFEQVEMEAQALSAQGIRHVILLSGESPQQAGTSYLLECCRIMKNYFDSISLEIFPLSTSEYQEMISAGADGLIVYQETYNRQIYQTLHPAGPKKDFLFRLDAPERGATAGMHSLGIGALLGLTPWRQEFFFTGLHAHWLMRKFPETEISVSLPRMRPHSGDFQPEHPISDRELVQAMLALRLFLPRAGISISTREEASFRENILPLGVTRISAGSCTEVGGYSSQAKGTGQFEVADHRSVPEMDMTLRRLGFQPVYKDWQTPA